MLSNYWFSLYSILSNIVLNSVATASNNPGQCSAVFYKLRLHVRLSRFTSCFLLSQFGNLRLISNLVTGLDPVHKPLCGVGMQAIRVMVSGCWASSVSVQLQHNNDSMELLSQINRYEVRTGLICNSMLPKPSQHRLQTTYHLHDEYNQASCVNTSMRIPSQFKRKPPYNNCYV